MREGRVGCCMVTGLSKGSTFVDPPFFLQFSSLKVHPHKKRDRRRGIICCFANGSLLGWLDRLTRRVLTAHTVTMRLCWQSWYSGVNYPSLPQYLWSGGKAILPYSCSQCAVLGMWAACASLLMDCGYQMPCRCLCMPLQKGLHSYRLATLLAENVSSQINTCLIIWLC